MAAPTIKERLERLALREILVAREGRLEEQARAMRLRHKEDADEEIWNLQWLIAKGKSTGDPILDLKIMLWGDTQKDKTYDHLLLAQDVLSSHPGELVCWNGQELGVLYDRPILTYTPPEATGRGAGKSIRSMPREIEIPVRCYLKLRYKPGFYSEECSIEINRDSFSHYDLISKSTLIVGNNSVHRWFLAQEFGGVHVNSLYAIWVAMKTLGHRFDPPPELAKEVRARQDKVLLKIHEGLVILQELCRRFENFKRYPVQAIRENQGIEILDTADGFQVKFRVVDEIKEQAMKLRNFMDEAEELEMSYNTAYADLVKSFTGLIFRYKTNVLEDTTF